MQTPGADEPLGLASAFSAQCPDREAFRRGVLERIEAHGEREHARQAQLAAAPRKLEWAASLFPPGLVGGLGAGASLSAKKFGLKLLPAVVAMPAIVLLMFLGAFAGGLRFLFSKQRAPQGLPGHGTALVEHWMARNRLALGLAGCLLAGLALWQSPEVLSVFLLISMTVTLLILSELSRSGLGDRERVTRFCMHALGWTALWWSSFRELLPSSTAEVSRPWGVFVLIVGTLASLLFGRPDFLQGIWQRIWHPERRMLYPDRMSTVCLRFIYVTASFFGLLIVGLWVWMLLLATESKSEPTRAGLVHYVEDFQEPLGGGFESWWEFMAVAAVLREDGGPQPDYGPLAERLAQEPLAADAPMPIGLGALLHVLGVQAMEPLSNRHSPRRMQEFWDRGGLLSAEEYGLIGLLVAEGSLSAEQRERLILRLDVSWPRLGNQFEFEGLLQSLRLLRALSANAVIAAHRADIEQDLLEHWGGLGSSKGAAAFRANREASWLDWFTSGISREDCRITSQALAIMCLVGVPEGIDARRLQACYGPESRLRKPAGIYLGWPLAGAQRVSKFYDLGAVQARALGTFEVTLWDRITKQRSVIGALFFSLLCLVAIARSPRPGERS